MDEQRKSAYRYLLYWAMLDIRPVQWIRWSWNPFRWQRHKKLIHRAGVIADWLHNLAVHSSVDFERFDENWFWREFDAYRERCPRGWLDHYRNIFQDKLSPPAVAGQSG